MLRAIEMGWFILEKYYNRTDEVPAYAAALLLDPRKRAAYIKQNWAESWIDPAIVASHTIWEEKYQTMDIPQPIEASSDVDMVSTSSINELDRLLQEIAVPADNPDGDNFMSFIEAPTSRIDCSPLVWWCRIEQRERYPRLSVMAIDILSIPPESAEAERVFSGARRTCSWDRLRLTCGSIEKIECIGSWLRQGLIKASNREGGGLASNPLEDEDIAGLSDEALDDIPWY
jgi:hypothetical protein